MIHYTCDLCHRSLDDRDERRYVVRIEMFPAVDGAGCAAGEPCDDRDYLLELHEALEQLDVSDFDAQNNGLGDGQSDEDSQELQFDLCPECRRRFAKNPLGRNFAAEFGFSSN
jgi:hypothetical protein